MSNDREVIVAEAVPPARKKWNWTVVLLVGTALIVSLGCCGLCGLGFSVGMQSEANKVAAEVRDHPLVQEKLGGITSCNFHMWDDLRTGDSDKHVFEVRGPKGTGRLITEEFWYRYVSIKLKTDEGEWELLAEEKDK